MLKFFSVNQSSFRPVAGGVAKKVYGTPLVTLLQTVALPTTRWKGGPLSAHVEEDTRMRFACRS